MALYKNASELVKSESADFDLVYTPGTKAPWSGIYICTNCRDEAACNRDDPLPPQNHRQHSTSKGDIRWKVLIKTQTGPN
ncbi:hypothetical protein [Rhizobium leguminosarum]|uniref:hypothetical protein n=1 Tax=Rhizobium leguminosarum TaxID=384 RepID=UPI001C9837A3|nr:hypothetical protein [Rhizobium leguminosarum]MBY5797770.1 protein L [Rhizobium leguminosarum]